MIRPYLGNPKYTIEVLQKYNFAFQKNLSGIFFYRYPCSGKIIRLQITKDILLGNRTGYWNHDPVSG